jgi:hypothetical protein
MKIKTEAGPAEEQPVRDISSGDEVIHFLFNSDLSEFFYALLLSL